MALSKSESFIEGHGSSLEQARARWILHRVKPELDAVQFVTDLQNDDGETCDVGATIEAVKVLKHYNSVPGERR